MKKIIMIVAMLVCLTSSLYAEEERTECFVINNTEICLTENEMLTIIEEFVKLLKNNKRR